MALVFFRSSVLRRVSQCLSQTRTIHRNTILRSKDLNLKIRPSSFEKKLMVYAKMYSSVEEVPAQVSMVQIKTSKDSFRVRVSIFMVIFAFVGAYIMILSGRRMKKAGDSLEKREMEKMAYLQEMGRQEREAKSKAEQES